MAKILAVDDSPTFLEAVTAMLQKHGHTVQTAFDSLEALAQMRADPPDAMLIDINLRSLDGLALSAVIRRTPGLNHVPIIIVSGSGRIIDRRLAEQLGATDYVPKPVDDQRLLGAIETCLRRPDSASQDDTGAG